MLPIDAKRVGQNTLGIYETSNAVYLLNEDTGVITNVYCPKILFYNRKRNIV